MKTTKNRIHSLKRRTWNPNEVKLGYKEQSETVMYIRTLWYRWSEGETQRNKKSITQTLKVEKLENAYDYLQNQKMFGELAGAFGHQGLCQSIEMNRTLVIKKMSAATLHLLVCCL